MSKNTLCCQQACRQRLFLSTANHLRSLAPLKLSFLSQQYSRKQVTAALRQPTAELTDRGVRYSR